MHKSFLSLFVILIPVYSLACVLALAGAVSGCATDQSGDGKMTDGKITTAVRAQINLHPDVGPPDSVRVETREHVVYLSGFVSTGLMKQTAEDLARQTPGVTRVVNEIGITK
jgi:osmotically-inducible protein OsmY